MKGDGKKGGKSYTNFKGTKGDGKGAFNPQAGKGKGEFQGYCNGCWGWGHQVKFCPHWKTHETNSVDVHESPSSVQTGNEQMIEMSSLAIRHENNAHNISNHARFKDDIECIDYQGNITKSQVSFNPKPKVSRKIGRAHV